MELRLVLGMRRCVGCAVAQPDAEALRRVRRGTLGDRRSGSWTGSPTLRFMWERCTTDGSLCKPAPDLGDENASTVRPGPAGRR